MAAASLLEADVVTADGSPHGQRVQRPGPVLGAEGRGRRELRRGHPADAAAPTPPRDLRRGAPRPPGRTRIRPTAGSSSASWAFYRSALFNPHWGEQVSSARGTDSGSGCSSRVWTRRRPRKSGALPRRARRSRTAGSHRGGSGGGELPGARLLEPRVPDDEDGGAVRSDPTPGAPANNLVGQQPGRARGSVARLRVDLDAGVAAPGGAAEGSSRRRSSPPRGTGRFAPLQQGARPASPPEAMAAARDTATNPAVLGAFALAIIAGGGFPRYPGVRVTPPTRRGPARTRRPSTPRWPSSASCVPDPRLLRLGEQLLRAELAARLLGRELRRASGGQEASTTRTASSSSTTAWAARTGARTG